MASTLDSVPVSDPGNFNPYDQEVIITMPDGHTQFAANLQAMASLQNATVYQAVIFGVQIGLSMLLMVILALMTKADKRRSIIFILNMATLIFIFIRAIIQCVQFSGPLFNFYNWAAAWYPDPGPSSRQSIAGEVCTFIIVLSMELSLLFQVRIVCCTLSTWQRILLDTTSAIAVFVTTALRFALMVLNIHWNILRVDSATPNQQLAVARVSSAANITVVVSITFFSIIFCTKLAHAIRSRRKIGMKSFGPMQIIFVMGCQTLVVPVIFGILSYWILPGSQIQSMVPVVVATFLPLSSIWASTNTDGNANIAAPAQWHNRRHPSTMNKSSHGYSSEKGLLHTTVNTDCTLVDRQQSVSEPTPTKSGRDSIDLEMQKMGRIRVDRAYSVRSD